MASKKPLVRLISFAFKHGIPAKTDLVFDVRSLRNPSTVPNYMLLSGLDQEIREFILEDPNFKTMCAAFRAAVEKLLGEKQGCEAPLHICFGCVGGRHRSVFVASHFSELLHENCEIEVIHRDLSGSSSQKSPHEPMSAKMPSSFSPWDAPASFAPLASARGPVPPDSIFSEHGRSTNPRADVSFFDTNSGLMQTLSRKDDEDQASKILGNVGSLMKRRQKKQRGQPLSLSVSNAEPCAVKA
uniref:RapZ C-terminal domain-containing protein n=1 Tax=Palpitomonas bilix TaxID=652834 RepID=A0A7S3D6M4_9EUKA